MILDTLEFGGKPLVPQVVGFNRARQSGVLMSEVEGGTVRLRKKYFGMSHIADVEFYLNSPSAMNYIQSFINDNEGKEFICNLAADRPIVEPYVCQAISDWDHFDVNAVVGSVKCQFEVFSNTAPVLDDFLYAFYFIYGKDINLLISGFSEIVEAMPEP